MDIIQLLEKKKHGNALTQEEIAFFVRRRDQRSPYPIINWRRF